MSTQETAGQVGGSQKFLDMGIGQQILFVFKLIIFLCSFGFAFPTLLND